VWKVSLRVASVLVPALVGIFFFVLTVKLHYHHAEAVAEFGEIATEYIAYLHEFIGFFFVFLSLLPALLYWVDRGRWRTAGIVALVIAMVLTVLAAVITIIILPRVMRTQDNASTHGGAVTSGVRVAPGMGMIAVNGVREVWHCSDGKRCHVGFYPPPLRHAHRDGHPPDVTYLPTG